MKTNPTIKARIKLTIKAACNTARYFTNNLLHKINLLLNNA